MTGQETRATTLAALIVLWCSAPFVSVGVADVEPPAQPARVIEISKHPQLFLDDFLIVKTDNVRRVMQQPQRHRANPLIVQDRPWERRMISVYGTVLYDTRTKKYRCWYSASESDSGVPDTPEAPGTAEYYQCYAESADGLKWIKPNVGKKQYGRHKQHNIVVSDAHGLCVLPTPMHSDPKRKYLAIGGATLVASPNGIDWHEPAPEENNWREAVQKNDTSSCVVYWKGEYLAFVRFQGKEHAVVDRETGLKWRGTMRKVGLCVSTDGIHWTPKQMIFECDKADGYPWTQPYGISVTPYGDVLIGLLPVLSMTPKTGNNSYGKMDVQLVVSRDGRHWSRVANRESFMKSASEESTGKRRWDMEIYPSTTLLVRNDTIHLYYTGKNILHGETRLPGNENLKYKIDIGLATLPADRFVALRPKNAQTEARLQTKMLRLSGQELLVNADVTAADLRVELLDKRGKVISGFEAARSHAITHDSLRFRIRWDAENGKQRSLRDASLKKPVALRFLWKSGSLFAFSIDGTL